MQKIQNISDLSISKKSRILVFMPHPDDETAFTGELLYLLSKNRIPVRVVVMTRGEKSTKVYGVKKNQKLEHVRTKELQKALNCIQIHDFKQYSIPDGGIPENTNKVNNIIQTEIAEFNPTHLVTIEPNGGYGHPDHISLTKCVEENITEDLSLIYATVSPNYRPSKGSIAMSKTGLVKPLEPTHFKQLSLMEAFQKFRMFKAHKSQFPLNPINPIYLFKLIKNGFLRKEYYHLL